MWALVCVWLKTMNASCGMDFCLSEGLPNNDHTNEVLSRENFNRGALPAPGAIDNVILGWAVLVTAMMTGLIPRCVWLDCGLGFAAEVMSSPQTQSSLTSNRIINALNARFRSR